MAEVELPNPEELEERRDKSFSRRVALTTAVYAVILAVASLGAGNAMKHMLLAQQQSSDQWAFYQAKVIREHLYRAQALVMQAELADVAAARGPRQEKVQALATKFADEEKRYNAEKKDIEKDAKKLEHDRDHYRTRDRYFEFAEVFLDGRAFKPDGTTATTLIPPAFGLRGVNLHTWNGWGAICWKRWAMTRASRDWWRRRPGGLAGGRNSTGLIQLASTPRSRRSRPANWLC